MRAFEGGDDYWIQLSRGLGAEDAHDLGVSEAGSIGAFLGQGTVDVGDGKDAHLERDIRSGELIGISGAVESFVVGSGDRGNFFERLDASQNLACETRVLLDALPLFRGEAAGLIEDGVWQREFSKVMEEGGSANELAPRLGEAEGARDIAGHLRYAEGVSIGEGRLCTDDIGEGLAEAVDLLMGEWMRLLGAETEDEPKRGVVVIEGQAAGPEGPFTVEGGGDLDQIRVEPEGAALAKDLQGYVRRACGSEDVEVLRDGEDAGEDGNGLVAKAQGIAMSIPVFIERFHCIRDGLAEANFADDLSPAFTAECDQLQVVLV